MAEGNEVGQWAWCAECFVKIDPLNHWTQNGSPVCDGCRDRPAEVTVTWPQCGHTDCDCPIEAGRCINCGKTLAEHVQPTGLIACRAAARGEGDQ